MINPRAQAAVSLLGGLLALATIPPDEPAPSDSDAAEALLDPA